MQDQEKIKDLTKAEQIKYSNVMSISKGKPFFHVKVCEHFTTFEELKFSYIGHKMYGIGSLVFKRTKNKNDTNYQPDENYNIQDNMYTTFDDALDALICSLRNTFPMNSVSDNVNICIQEMRDAKIGKAIREFQRGRN